MDDPYAILGLQPGATRDEIVAAYRALSARFHPSAIEGAPLSERIAAERRAKDVAAAYRMLTDQVPDPSTAPPPPRVVEVDGGWQSGTRARFDADAARLDAYHRGRREGWRTVGLLIACGAALFVPLFAVARLLS